jgi:hypothetical protein
MLGGYGPGLPFDQYPEFKCTEALLQSARGLDPEVPLLNLEVRGSMGAYWLSRSDLPDTPLQPTSGG